MVNEFWHFLLRLCSVIHELLLLCVWFTQAPWAVALILKSMDLMIILCVCDSLRHPGQQPSFLNPWIWWSSCVCVIHSGTLGNSPSTTHSSTGLTSGLGPPTATLAPTMTSILPTFLFSGTRTWLAGGVECYTPLCLSVCLCACLLNQGFYCKVLIKQSVSHTHTRTHTILPDHLSYNCVCACMRARTVRVCVCVWM